MLTQAQKVSVRYHMGVPFAGTAQAGRLYGWRFTWYNEDLEFRLNNMQPAEEVYITGNSLGSFKVQGQPTVGDVLTFGISDNQGNNFSVPYTVKQSDFAQPANPVNPSIASPLYSIALNAANALNAVIASKGYAAVGVMPADLFSPGYMPPYFGEVDIMGPGSSTFTLTASTSGGATTAFLVGSQGTPCPIRSAPRDPVTGIATPVYGYVALLDVLGMLMPQAEISLWLQQAGKATFRNDEVRARFQLYKTYCIKMEEMLGSADYVRKFGLKSSGGASA